MIHAAHDAALDIIAAYHAAESALLNRAAVRHNGEAGTIAEIFLDAEHGIRFRFKGRRERWPVSTLKLVAIPC